MPAQLVDPAPTPVNAVTELHKVFVMRAKRIFGKKKKFNSYTRPQLMKLCTDLEFCISRIEDTTSPSASDYASCYAAYATNMNATPTPNQSQMDQYMDDFMDCISGC